MRRNRKGGYAWLPVDTFDEFDDLDGTLALVARAIECDGCLRPGELYRSHYTNAPEYSTQRASCEEAVECRRERIEQLLAKTKARAKAEALRNTARLQLKNKQKCWAARDLQIQRTKSHHTSGYREFIQNGRKVIVID